MDETFPDRTDEPGTHHNRHDRNGGEVDLTADASGRIKVTTAAEAAFADDLGLKVAPARTKEPKA